MKVSRYAVTIQLLRLNDWSSLEIASKEVLTMAISRLDRNRLSNNLYLRVSSDW